ncbi:hypothetical protein VTL71DRAFT_14031 [Oculimacula yallundae]|uniref:Zn(2)-C6 fungal-type domain-containing protein n=1 Tax=Oculimacula yallundae TaxID=86028 RepID=A0ABR4CMF9_9HELO
MVKEARSKGACWSCRLRRKKCDELYPACATCNSHALPCYGYERPTWADGGSLQKAKVEELQFIIRNSASSKRRLLKQDKSKKSVDVKNPLKELELVQNANVIPEASRPTNSADISEMPLHHYVEIRELFHDRLLDEVRNTVAECDPQGELLAHYLDVVFPTQFPMCSDSKTARTWLLPLILQVKPLYHAAISIASYHKEISGEPLSERNYVNIHHGLALKELRQYLTKCQGYDLLVSLESNIEVLASIVLIVSLEVLLGDTESWAVHLKGPLLLLPSLRRACAQRSILSPQHLKGLEFFTGVIVWYNALSCLSTGLEPWAPTSCLRTAIHGWVDVHAVTGCQNEVVISIIEIAALSEQTKRLGWEKDMVTKAREIHVDIEKWIQPLNTTSKQFDSADALVTLVFASAAQVYLNIVAVELNADSPRACVSISQALVALEAIDDPHILSTLAWPLCITGCMATGWQRDVMKKLFAGMSKAPPLQLGGLERCRRIIEECWRLRDEECGNGARITWAKAMSTPGLTFLLV